MQVLLAEITYCLLFAAAFNVRIRRDDHHLNDDQLSYEAMKRLMTQLEQNMEKHLEREEVHEENVTTPTSTTSEVTTTSEHSHGDITVRLYPVGMNYVLEQIMLAIRHDAIRHRPHTIRTFYHGMDINVDSIQLVDFVAPKLEIERLSETRFRFFTHGGGMRYLGLYSTVFKTTREGQFEALLDDVRIQLDVEFEEEEGSITVTDNKCNAWFEDVIVQLTPTMPSQIVNLLSERIQDRFREKICPALLHYVEKIAKITKSLASIEDINRWKDGSNSPCPVDHDRIASRLDTRGAKLSFKRTFTRHKRSTITTNAADHETIAGEMASVTVTEDYINEMLYDLVDSGDVLIHLHRIPEVQDVLRTHCDDTHCLGAFVDLDTVAENSGHLNSRIISTPKVEFHNGHAIVHLSLATVLSFENRAAHHRIPYLRFETDITMRLTELELEPSENVGYYKWTARYDIVELKTNNVHTDFEEMKGIATHLENHLKLHQDRVEDLLSTHLNGELPLHLNPHVHLQPQSSTFGHHRVIIPLNFKVDKKLFPAFQFFHNSFI